MNQVVAQKEVIRGGARIIRTWLVSSHWVNGIRFGTDSLADLISMSAGSWTHFREAGTF
jgi:hypothetical protein